MLMAAQVAAGCALLSGAALLTQSVAALRAQPLGFDAEAVAFLSIDPAGAGLDEPGRTALVGQLLELPLGPGIGIAIVDELPFQQHSMLFVGAEESDVPRAYPFPTSRVGGPYFDTLGIDLVAGRAFDPADRGQPVAILSRPLADLFWPGLNPLGRMVRVGGRDGEPHAVVGVVAGLRDATLRAGETSRLYLPYDDKAEGLAILARPAAGPPAQLLPALHDLARDFDPRLVAIQTGTLSQLAVSTIEQRLLFRLLTATIGLGSLLMIAAGVWGLSHGSLRRRWREFGIRQALGAGRGEVARLAFADARFVALVGGGLGVLAGWQFGRVLEAWLFEVGPWDPLALGSAALLVLCASAAGAIWPARQATRLNAAELLRQE
jgi:putative ABC transport system permease protein